MTRVGNLSGATCFAARVEGDILDEFSRECLAIKVKRMLKANDVIDALSDLFILRGVPAFIRSDNGPEFVTQAVRDWIAAVGASTAYIEPGSPWENGYCESSALGYRPPAPETIIPMDQRPVMH